MSDETGALIDAFATAVRWSGFRPNARLDCEIAEGKLRGHIATLEARAERAERERDEVCGRVVQLAEFLNEAHASRDSARAWARRWKRAAQLFRGLWRDAERAHELEVKEANGLRARLESVEQELCGLALAHKEECERHDATKARLEAAERERDDWKRAAESQNNQWSQKCTELTEERAAREQAERELKKTVEAYEDVLATRREHELRADERLSDMRVSAANARAWARRWKRAAKMFRHQYLYTYARLEKWRTAARMRLPVATAYLTGNHGTYARVPEGEE